MLVLDVGVTEDLSRRATGLRLVFWRSRKATSMEIFPINQEPARGGGKKVEILGKGRKGRAKSSR